MYNFFEKIDNYFNQKRVTFVLFILILNLFLKFFYVVAQSFWLDEINQIYTSIQTPAEIIKLTLKDPNAPLFSFVLHFWIQIFGISELAINSLSVLFSASTAGLIYLLGGKLFNYRVASFAALVFTFSNSSIYYAHEARSYAMLVFLTILSFYLFFEIIKKYSHTKILIYFLTSLMLAYTHLSGLLIFPVQTLFLFAILKESFKQNLTKSVLIFGSQVLAFVLLLVWLLNNSWLGGNETTWMSKPTLDTVFLLFVRYFNNRITLFVFLLLSITAIFFFFKRKENKINREILTIIVWGFFPIIAIYLVSVLYNPRFTQRYMLLATPALYFIMIWIADYIAQKKYLKYIFFVLILISFAHSLTLNPKKPEKWDIVVEKFNKIKDNKTLTFINASYQFASFSYYYNIEYFKNYKKTIHLLKKENIIPTNRGAELIDEFDFEKYNKLVLLLSHENKQSNENSLLTEVRKNYELIDIDENLHGISFYAFDLKTKKYELNIYIDYESEKYRNKAKKTENAPSGEYVFEINQNTEFAEGINTTCLDFFERKINIIEVSCEYLSAQNSNFKIVCSLHHNDEQYFWEGKDFIGEKSAEWLTFNKKFRLPEIKDKNDVLKIYIWNPDKNTFLIDNFKVSIK